MEGKIMTKKMTFKAAKESAKYITVSEGNKKLVPTKDTKYIVFNLPAIITCPYATEHCKMLCYALKAERCYKTARIARQRNYIDTMRPDFVERMIFTIEANLNRPGYKAAKKIIVRVHESGDFYSKRYAMYWCQIAAHFAGDKRVVFMAYTKSIEFFKGEDIPKNMVVRFSLWDDTDPEQAKLAEEMGLPVYTAVKAFTNETKREKCLCENCSTCNKCWCKAIEMIKCEIH